MARAAHPHAIVLGLNGTGLATARCLAAKGITVHALSFDARDPGRHSRACEIVDLEHLAGDEEAFGIWLRDYCRAFDPPAVVFPTSDATALLLAEHREELGILCRVWRNRAEDLRAIIRKDRLYRAARAAGIPVPPTIIAPEGAELVAWCRHHKAPYLIKPYYAGHAECALREKNRVFRSAEALLDHAARWGTRALIVQRQLKGGDGRIFDAYGLSGADRMILSLASHRRLRQYPPHRGTTCFGEIPGLPPCDEEAQLFALTRRLLGVLEYHGIFGIEWLRDEASGEFCLLDFDARPFTTIGHLADCGLNLPWLAYREILGLEPAEFPSRPRLKHKVWLQLDRDLRSFCISRRRGELSVFRYLPSLFMARSWALWTWRDPLPCFHTLLGLLASLLNKIPLIHGADQAERKSGLPGMAGKF